LPHKTSEIINARDAGTKLSCNKDPLDYYVRKEGKVFAGTHLLIDIWGASYLDDRQKMEEALIKCVEVTKATLLHIHLHHFTSNGGISGVAILAESHISVHTWPERGYAAFDVFMCGGTIPANAIAVIQKAFKPQKVEVTENQRGLLERAP